MKRIFYFLFKIWLILFSICSIGYILFFNSPEEALKKLSLTDAIYFYTMQEDDSKEISEFKKNIIKEFTAEHKHRTGIDISKPIYDVIKNNKDVTQLELSIKRNRPNIDNIKIGYIIFNYHKNKISIPLIVEDSSFLDVKEAKIYAILEDFYTFISEVGQLYGINKQDINGIYNYFKQISFKVPLL